MGRLWTIARTGFLAIAIVGIADSAIAATDICQRLQTRLLALDNGHIIGAPEDPGALNRSIRKQRDELDRARAEARRHKCLGSTFFQRLRAKANCAAITASIERMKANLSRLTASHNPSLSDPFAKGRERSELVHALAENRCDQLSVARSRPANGRGFFATLFGGHRLRERGFESRYHRNDTGTYRTLCVRACDGYYFPISFSTSRSRFASDEQSCQLKCPGTPVSLYVHRNPGQESEAMVSLTGEPYTALPTAFRYRKEYDAACRCGPIEVLPLSQAVGYVAEHTTPRRDDPWRFSRSTDNFDLSESLPPVPSSRPAAGEDPETLANRAGGFRPRPVKPREATIAELSGDAERSIRIVGPSFFYGQ